jgi:hydroxyacylglutathione hydrolase
MYFKQIFDEKLAQYSYIIGCQKNGEALVIDPMRDIDTYIQIAAKENLKIVAAADTHIHADYLSGLRELAERGVKVYASDEGDADWKYEWLNGSKYTYQLLKDGDVFSIGNIRFKAWHTPGHTPEHLSYFVTDGAAADEPLGIATGDFVFVGDVGRPDLLESAAGHVGNMEPSARRLFSTVEKFKSVPEYLQVWPGHGAGSACGKALGAIPESTVGYELRFNQSIRASSSEDEFVKFILDGQPEPPMYFARMKRDNKLGPKVLGSLPNPKHLSLLEIEALVENKDNVIIDTRTKDAFAMLHLPGSLLSTLNKQFNTVIGSFVEEHEKMYLVIDHANVQEAVIDLVRIGLDNILGYITPADLALYAENGGKTASMKGYTFEQVKDLAEKTDYAILDVRKATEFSLGAMPNAQNIAHTRLHARIKEVPKDKKLIVHCQAGGRSAVAGAYLKRAGYDIMFVDDQFEHYEALVSTTA